jgi:predicted nucleotidyltransferase
MIAVGRGTVTRLDGAPTLSDLRARRGEILLGAAARGARNVHVFGSVARGQARADSDVDLREALGRDVDVVEIRTPSPAAERVLREAVPL